VNKEFDEKERHLGGGQHLRMDDSVQTVEVNGTGYALLAAVFVGDWAHPHYFLRRFA
jgi:hypothetical protein